MGKVVARKGITLIALVITIIVLIILAGITISLTISENDLFSIAKKAKDNTLESQEVENITLGNYENIMDSFIGGTSREETVNLTEKLQLIGKNMGAKIVIPNGYKYVIISNHYWTATSKNCVNYSKLASNTNCSIILQDTSSNYDSYNGSAGWLIVAQITDTSENAIFNMNGSDYNIVFGIRE